MQVEGALGNMAGDRIEYELSIVEFKQDNIQILYAPALEIYGYGKNLEEAKKSFETCLHEFVEYTIAKGTFFSEFKRLGWKIKGKKSNRIIKMPNLSDLLKNNDRLVEIIDTNDIRTYKENIPLPIPA